MSMYSTSSALIKKWLDDVNKEVENNSVRKCKIEEICEIGSLSQSLETRRKSSRRRKSRAHSEASISSTFTSCGVPFESVQPNSTHLKKKCEIKESDLKQALKWHKQSPAYKKLKEKKFTPSPWCAHHHDAGDYCPLFSECEFTEFKSGCVGQLPNIKEGLPEQPGTKYADVFANMPDLCSDFKECFRGIKNRKRGRKKFTGYNGKPMDDSAMMAKYDWTLDEEENRPQILKCPSSELLSLYVKKGITLTPDKIAKLDKVATEEVRQIAEARNSVKIDELFYRKKHRKNTRSQK